MQSEYSEWKELKLTVEEEFPQGQNLGCTNKQKLLLNWWHPWGYLICIRHGSTVSTKGAVLVCRVQPHVSSETGIALEVNWRGNLGICVPLFCLLPPRLPRYVHKPYSLLDFEAFICIFFLIISSTLKSAAKSCHNLADLREPHSYLWWYNACCVLVFFPIWVVVLINDKVVSSEILCWRWDIWMLSPLVGTVRPKTSKQFLRWECAS